MFGLLFLGGASMLFGLGSSGHAKNLSDAITRSQALIEFDLEGNIQSVNDNFCQTVGYTRSEIVGGHHRIFCDPMFVASSDYTSFWRRLAAGSFESGVYE